MFMKNIPLLLRFALIMALGLTACQGDKGGSASTTEEAVELPTTPGTSVTISPQHVEAATQMGRLGMARQHRPRVA